MDSAPQARRAARSPRWPFRQTEKNAKAAYGREITAGLPEPNESVNAIHWMALVAGFTLLFVKLSNVPELLYTITGVNFKILYLVAPFAYIGVAFSRGLQSSLQSRATILFLLFYGWIVFSTPFSSWVGGSVGVLTNYSINSLPLIFVVSALVLTWNQVSLAFHMVALSGLTIIVSTYLFGVEMQGRLQLSSSGTIGNSNDLAAHLLMLLPFLLYVALESRRNLLVRILAVAAIVPGLYYTLATGSRGALVAIGAGIVFFLILAETRVRLGFMVASLALLIALPIVLPSSTKARLAALFGEEHVEAEESGASRQYLFNKSVEYTLARPIFGVGMEQFGNYEGSRSRAAGQFGSWHTAHCTWTQTSAECGIPALVFLLGALGMSFLSLYKCYSQARKLNSEDIARACLCLMLSFVLYFVAVTFLSHAFRYSIPVLVGLTIATVRAARSRLNLAAAPASLGDSAFHSPIH